MEELSLVISQPDEGKFLQKIGWNKEQIMNAVAEITKQYTGLTYTEEQMQDAKKDRATLNAMRKDISGRRIQVKKALMAPYEAFEAEVKEVVAIRHRKSRRRLMKEARYSLTQEQLNDLAAIAADRAVEAYRSEEQKTQKRKDNENVRITKKKLQSYRRVKASLAETEEFTEDEKIELRWAFVRDLMGSGLDVVEKADNRIRSVENKRKRDSFEIQSIDKAMALYKKEADNSSSEEAKRRYRELHAMYIDDEAHDVKEIAEMENISEKIVYRDIGIACKILAVYLLGM